MNADLLAVLAMIIAYRISTAIQKLPMIASISAFNIRIAKVAKYADSTNALFQNVRKMWNAMKESIALRRLDSAFP